MIWLLITIAFAEGPEPSAEPQPPAPMAVNREWDVLKPINATRDVRAVLRDAATELGDWQIDLTGIKIDGAYLKALADSDPEEPITRHIRETTKRAIDVGDFLYFLDDVLKAGADGRRGEAFFVHAGRARSAGILIHPDDVFKGKPREYPKKKSLSVDEPRPQAEYPPAEDGDPLGPNWTTRFKNPSDAPEMYLALAEARPQATYPSRIASLLAQLERQGAEVYLTSTVRNRHRGYLMWDGFYVSTATSEAELDQRVSLLEKRNGEWGLNAPITWTHPDGWEATVEAARVMTDTYDVVYATEKGAQYSNHYGGEAADFVAIGLPRELTLYAPDGKHQVFDLSDPDETRDLSLTPALIAWVSEHYGFRKLESDYPHWNDNWK